MSGEHHHHHHRRENEDQDGGYQGAVQTDTEVYGSSYGDPVVAQQTTDYQVTGSYDDDIAKEKAKQHREKREEEVAGFGGLAAGAFALHERKEAKKDPEHARRHQLEEEIAGAGAVGAEGTAFYEHHEKKKTEEEEKKEEEASGEKKHHWYSRD